LDYANKSEVTMNETQDQEVKQLRMFLEEVMPEGELERVAEEAYEVEGVAPEIDKLARGKREVDLTRTAMVKLARNEEMSPNERFAIEAIILPQRRPVIDINNDTFETPSGEWEHLGEGETRAKIEAAIPSVGRVELPDHPRLPYGGTGFVVGPNLLMTNRHVADNFSSGLGRQGLHFIPGQSAGVDFRREQVGSESIFVDVVKVVMIHPYWDMALLQVSGLPEEQRPLPLSTDHPHTLRGRNVAVIGYPAFDPRNDAELQHRIFRRVYNVKRLQPGTLTGRKLMRSFENIVNAMKHNASTLGGNSGSMLLDLKTGHVVGLHFAGVYLESNYAVPAYGLARDPYVVDAGVNFVGRTPTGWVSWMPRWRAADLVADVEDRPVAASPTPAVSPPPVAVDAAVTPEHITWTIPLQVTISIGTPTSPVALGVTPVPGLAPAAVEKPKTTPDPNYQNRTGYDPEFLPGGHTVEIPWLKDAQFAKVARNHAATSKRHVLPYHHFSIVMNRERSMAFFTAVNIDGKQEVPVKRSDFEDFWALDPRIDEAFQLDNAYYRDAQGVENPLDRGHLVRRLDPCWGATQEEVLAAHHDTFHWTNASPQHKGFNRYQTFWGGMEDYILDNANAEDLRVTVFSGPVFRDDDPVYMTPTGLQVQLPLEYWKVVAMVKDDGQLSASGYLLSQSGHVDSMIEEFVFGPYREYQTSIAHIEELTGIEFRDLAGADAFSGTEEAIAGTTRPISSYADIVF
jgi:endonuclease G